MLTDLTSNVDQDPDFYVFLQKMKRLDSILGVPMRYGNGYGLNSGWLPNPRTCFWGGWGGSMVVVDLDARMTVSYVMNQMLDQSGMGDGRAFDIVVAAYDGLSG